MPDATRLRNTALNNVSFVTTVELGYNNGLYIIAVIPYNSLHMYKNDHLGPENITVLLRYKLEFVISVIVITNIHCIGFAFCFDNTLQKFISAWKR